MVRTAGLNTEIVKHLIDSPIASEPGAQPRRFTTSDLAAGQRPSSARGSDPFAHAVLELASLSLRAGSVLALRS